MRSGRHLHEVLGSGCRGHRNTHGDSRSGNDGNDGDDDTVADGHAGRHRRYVGDWTGHTRGMALSSDGTGTMSVFSGAADGEDWTLTWGASGGGVDVTLVSRTSVVGDGLSGAMNAGATYRGTLTSDSAGVTYMTMTGFGNGGYPVTWCNRERYGSSPECGA